MVKPKIIFLILPQTHLLDLAGPDQVFLELTDSDADIKVEYCSPVKEILTSSHLSISKLKHFSKVKVAGGDYIFIPGANVHYLMQKNIPGEKEMISWLKDAYHNGTSLCSVCSGAFFLAKTGLLNGKRCTTHWKRTAELKQKFPHINLVENILFTEDEKIFTSAGVTAGIDLALYIVSKIKDESFSFRIARELVVYMRRKGNEAQQSVFMNYRNHIHAGIHEVQDYVQENISRKISLSHLAGIAYMSPRNLSRIFKKETGVTVNNYVTLIRKELLQNLTDNPDLTRKQMADLCGLKSERQVIRLLQN